MPGQCLPTRFIHTVHKHHRLQHGLLCWIGWTDFKNSPADEDEIIVLIWSSHGGWWTAEGHRHSERSSQCLWKGRPSDVCVPSDEHDSMSLKVLLLSWFGHSLWEKRILWSFLHKRLSGRFKVYPTLLYRLSRLDAISSLALCWHSNDRIG